MPPELTTLTLAGLLQVVKFASMAIPIKLKRGVGNGCPSYDHPAFGPDRWKQMGPPTR